MKKIGVRHVDSRAMVPQGFNPHTYDPTPQQISALSGVVLYVRTGVPFENAWMEHNRSADPEMRVIDARDGIALRAMEAHSHDEDGHGAEHYEEERHGHARGTDAPHDDHGEHDARAAEHYCAHERDPHEWTSHRSSCTWSA